MRVVNKVEDRYDTPFWRRQNMTIDDFPTVQKFVPECSCERQLEFTFRKNAFAHEKFCTLLYQFFDKMNVTINKDLFKQLVDDNPKLTINKNKNDLAMLETYNTFMNLVWKEEHGQDTT